MGSERNMVRYRASLWHSRRKFQFPVCSVDIRRGHSTSSPHSEGFRSSNSIYNQLQLQKPWAMFLGTNKYLYYYKGFQICKRQCYSSNPDLVAVKKLVPSGIGGRSMPMPSEQGPGRDRRLPAVLAGFEGFWHSCLLLGAFARLNFWRHWPSFGWCFSIILMIICVIFFFEK